MKLKKNILFFQIIKIMSGTLLLFMGYVAVRLMYSSELTKIFGGILWVADGIVVTILLFNGVLLYLFFARPFVSLFDYFDIVRRENTNNMGLPAESKNLFQAFCNSIQQEMDKNRLELQTYSQQVALRSSLIRELKQEYDKKVYDLFTLFDVARELNSTLVEKKISQTMLLTCMGQMGVRSAIVYRIEGYIDFKLEACDARGMDLPKGSAKTLSIGGAFIKHLVTVGKGVILDVIKDQFNDDDDFQKLKDLGTSLIIPFVDSKEIKAALAVGPKVTGEAFTPNQVEFLSILTNLGGLAMENAKLYTMAITDGLTRLYIQRYFILRADEEIKRSKRYSHQICMIMIDVDNFKKINDTYGHLEGNKILKGIAAILIHGTRETDVTARYGGEEFAILMPMTDKQSGYIVADRILKMVEKTTFTIRNTPLKVTVSIGVSSYPLDGETSTDILDCADKMLYKAKASGKNAIVVSP